MEYKPKILVPDIDDHVFTNEDGVNEDKKGWRRAGNDDGDWRIDDETMPNGSSAGWLEQAERDECEKD